MSLLDLVGICTGLVGVVGLAEFVVVDLGGLGVGVACPDLTGRREVTAILVVVTLGVELRRPGGKLNSRPCFPFGGGV